MVGSKTKPVYKYLFAKTGKRENHDSLNVTIYFFKESVVRSFNNTKICPPVQLSYLD